MKILMTVSIIREMSSEEFAKLTDDEVVRNIQAAMHGDTQGMKLSVPIVFSDEVIMQK